MPRNRKLLIGSVLIILASLIIGWFVLFEYGVKHLEKELDLLATNLRQKGYTFSYSSVRISGNPTNINAVFVNPHIKDPKGIIEWQGGELDVSMRPWNIYSLRCTFPGDQKVTGPQNIPIPLGTLSFENARGLLTLTRKGKLDELQIKADKITSKVGITDQPVYLEDPSLEVKNLSQPLTLKVSFTTNVFNVEKVIQLEPLDHPLKIKFEGALSGFQPQNPFPQSLAQWRDGGGVLEVEDFKVSWAPMIVEAKGTLTLDEDMYPLGSFSSRIVAYQEALTYLAQMGVIKDKNVAAASFVLQLFTQSDENGTKHLKIPITLQNKRLSVGPATLLKLKPIKDM